MEFNERLSIQLTGDLRIHRPLNNMWQVSGAHGPIGRRKAIQVIERRPGLRKCNLCQDRQVWLTYGTLCGGFLSV